MKGGLFNSLFFFSCQYFVNEKGIQGIKKEELLNTTQLAFEREIKGKKKSGIGNPKN